MLARRSTARRCANTPRYWLTASAGERRAYTMHDLVGHPGIVAGRVEVAFTQVWRYRTTTASAGMRPRKASTPASTVPVEPPDSRPSLRANVRHIWLAEISATWRILGAPGLRSQTPEKRAIERNDDAVRS